MAYGTIKVNNITFDDGGSDQTVTVSGLYNAFTNDIAVTGTISGTTVTGTTANFVSGVFTTQISGTTVTGTTSSFTTGNFTTLSGATATFTSGVIASGTATNPSLSFVGDPNTGIFSPGADQVAVATNGVQRLTVDSSGRLLAGTSTSRIVGIGTSQGQIQIEQPSTSNAIFSLITNRNVATVSPRIELCKTRGTALGSTNIVSNVELLGSVAFNGADGTNLIPAALIEGYVDGTPGANDMPGRLIFSTTPSGSATPTERLRITSAGLVGIGTSAPSSLLHLSGANVDTALKVQAGTAISTIELLRGSNATFGADSTYDYRVKNEAGDFTLQNGVNSTITDLITVTFTGNVGIGTTSPATTLDVNGDVTITDKIIHGGDTNTAIRFPANDTVSVETNGSERARIDSSGRLLVGTSSARQSRLGTGSYQTQFQLESSDTQAGLAVSRFNDAAGSSFFNLQKGRGTNASPAAVIANDVTGNIVFSGWDGATFTNSALIRSEVDGTPGANDMPGRLVFSVTADGASSPTEALRITNDRVVAYNQATPAAVNATATLTVANLKTGIITSTSAAATDMTLPTGTDTEAGFSGLYTNFTFEWTVINTGPSLVRVLAATAHTIVGSGSVATGTSGRFASRRTAANTFVTYRLS
jgi:hypothetical protein